MFIFASSWKSQWYTKKYHGDHWNLPIHTEGIPNEAVIGLVSHWGSDEIKTSTGLGAHRSATNLGPLDKLYGSGFPGFVSSHEIFAVRSQANIYSDGRGDRHYSYNTSMSFVSLSAWHLGPKHPQSMRECCILPVADPKPTCNVFWLTCSRPATWVWLSDFSRLMTTEI